MIRTRDVIFDESTYYDPSEIDAAKLLKSMIELPIEASDIEQNARIIEIESESESDSKVEQISTSSSNMKGKEVEIEDNQKVLHQLLTPEPEPEPESHQSSHIGSSAAPATPRAPEIAYQSPIGRRTASRDIRSAIEETNIIPQGVSRIKRVRKEAHAVALKQAKSGEISAYHIAFSCFIAARNYYSKESTTKNSTNDSKSTSIKNHRDDIPPEPANYNQMLKHFHSLGFKQVIQVEINQLKSMNV